MNIHMAGLVVDLLYKLYTPWVSVTYALLHYNCHRASACKACIFVLQVSGLGCVVCGFPLIIVNLGGLKIHRTPSPARGTLSQGHPKTSFFSHHFFDACLNRFCSILARCYFPTCFLKLTNIHQTSMLRVFID